MSRTTSTVRAALVVSIISALSLLPTLASGAGQPPTTSTTIAPSTTIVEPEPEPEPEPQPEPEPATAVDGDALPDAAAADADAVAGQPTFTG